MESGTPRALVRAMTERAPHFSFSVVDGRAAVRIVVRMPLLWRVVRALTFGLATQRVERDLLAAACEQVPAGVAVEMVVL